MDYTPLSKLFHSNRNEYNAILKQRLNDDTTVHLDFIVSDNQAFFLPLPQLYKYALEIERADKRIQMIMNILPGAALGQFVNKCLIDEIVVTNNIEGVHSTRREIGDILSELEKKDKNRRFKGLVAKYAMLMNDEDIPLDTCNDIREIYNELVLQEVAEEDSKDLPDGKLFRKESVSVYSETQKEIHRGLYPEQAILDAMDNALAILNNKNIESLFRISLYHYFFGYIHPFYNGNGRMSRFISSYLLSRELNSILGYRISFTIKENIKEYYEAFRICNDHNSHGDLTPFLLMFMDIIEKSIIQLENALMSRVERLKNYNDRIPQLPVVHTNNKNYEIYYVLIQAGLFAENGISTVDLLEHLKTTRATLSKYLRIIDDNGLLIIKKIGREKFYSLDLSKVDEIETASIV